MNEVLIPIAAGLASFIASKFGLSFAQAFPIGILFGLTLHILTQH